MLVKALAWGLPGGPILSALATVAGALLKAVAWIIAKAVDGLTRMLANPTTFVTAFMVALACLAGGIRLGVKWDSHVVKKAADRLEMVEAQRDDLTVKFTAALDKLSAARLEIEQWEGRLHDQQTQTSHALMARAKAEDDVRIALEKAEARARGARAALARDRALRVHNPVGSAPAASGGVPKAGPKDAPKT